MAIRNILFQYEAKWIFFLPKLVKLLPVTLNVVIRIKMKKFSHTK